MRVINAPVVWLDWRPGFVVAGWIIVLNIQGKTRPSGIRSLTVNLTWGKRTVQQ